MSIEGIENRQASGKTSVEQVEAVSSASVRWLAGALEVGGTVAFGIHREKSGRVSAYPHISLQQHDEELIALLKKEYGGSRIKGDGAASGWRLGGYKAADMISDMEPYAVSRSEMVLAVKNWLDSETAQRIQIAEEMKGYERYADGSIDQYISLVRDPDFVAGILDNRGRIYPFFLGAYTYPRIEVGSKNENLLEALRRVYGGNLRCVLNAGTRGNINGKEFETKRNSYVLNLSNAKARRVIELTQGHVKAESNRNWERKISERQKHPMEHQTLQLQSAIQEELGQISRGELGRISTAEELAMKFSLDLRKTRLELSLLPTELRKQREAIMRSENRHALTGQDVQKLLSELSEEIGQYKNGEILKLSHSVALARQAGVNVHTFHKYVISKLPNEVQEWRWRILLSQASERGSRKLRGPKE